MGSKGDLRVQKTKRAFEDAFFSLPEGKEYDRVTIHDICRSAMVNRNTFYAHYTDRTAFLQVLCSENLTQIQSIIDIRQGLDRGSYLTLLKGSDERLLTLMAGRRTFYRAVFAERLAQPFYQLSRGALSENMMTKNTIKDRGLHLTLRTEYVAGCFLALVNLWLENEALCSQEELVEFF